MNRFLIVLFSFALLVSVPLRAGLAFEVVDRKTSYEGNKFLTMGIGLGMSGFTRQEGLSGDPGFGIRVSVGHHITRYLETAFVYRLTTFRFTSPDPVFIGSEVNTRAAMNQGALHFNLIWPMVAAEPYLSGGIGFYNMFGVDSKTALRFPTKLQVPLGVGVRAYFWRHTASIDFNFSYQFLIGENQPQETLDLLGISKISFDTWSAMTSATFHLF